MKKTMVSILILGIFSFALTGCDNDRTILNFGFDGCTRIELRNGTTGDLIEK